MSFEDHAISLINRCTNNDERVKVFEQTCEKCCYSPRQAPHCDRCPVAVAFDNWKPLVLEPKFKLAYRKT